MITTRWSICICLHLFSTWCYPRGSTFLLLGLLRRDDWSPRDCWRWPWQDQERSGMFAGGTVPWPKCPQCGYWLRFASSVPHPLTVFFFPLLSRCSSGSGWSRFHTKPAAVLWVMCWTPRFNLQDLNSNGLLEESELIELNEFIAVLHYGTDFDRDLLEKKFRNIFRSLEQLDRSSVSSAEYLKMLCVI